MGSSGGEPSFRGTPRFQLLSRLGRGGMGVVYEAFDRDQDTRVALKTVSKLTAESLLRFKHEFRSLQDLRHPNLIRLGELQEADGTWFFTMELIEGVDLLRYVRPQARRQVAGSGVLPSGFGRGPELIMETEPTEDVVASTAFAEGSSTNLTLPGDPRPFDEQRLRHAIRQLAIGLSTLHAARMVHRDIKPGNVLVTRDDRVVILDFGLVSDATGKDDSGPRAGTVVFMAPEQAHARPVGAAADWYSVGVTLYMMLTGRPPFTGSLGQMIAPRDDTPPTPPSVVNPRVPHDLSVLCMGLLRYDPEQRLDGRAILAVLGAPSAAELERTHPAARALFVGRSQELDRLEDGFDRVLDGHAVSLLVSGESGVGKSALVRHFVDDLAGAGTAIVLPGRCYERESVPYKALDQVIDALSHHLLRMSDAEVEPLLPPRIGLLASVFTVLKNVRAIARAASGTDARALDPFQHRAHVFAALRELFARLGQRTRVVITIDDLQWADADSLVLLSELLRAPDAPPLLLLATVRELAGRAHVIATLREYLGEDVRELHLERLPPYAARELVERLVERSDVKELVRTDVIASEAEGHPLFIDALVRHRLGHPETMGPVRLDDALVARADALGVLARHVLELVCIAGGTLQQEACARAAGVNFAALTELAGALRAANLVKTNGVKRSDLIEPYHDRVREAIAQRLTSVQRAGAHLRLAEALEATRGADPEMLAAHFRGGGDSKRAAHHAALAAERAERALAFDRAARLYRDALDHPASTEEAQRLRRRLADALSNAGRGSEAAEAFLAAARTAPADETFELSRLAAEQFLRAGRIDAAAQTLEAVLATVGKKLPHTRVGAILAFLYGRARLKLRGTAFALRDESEVAPETLRRLELCHSMLPLGMTDTLRGQPFNCWHLRLSLDAGHAGHIVRSLAPEMVFVATWGARYIERSDAHYAVARRLAYESNEPYLRGLIEGAAGVAAYCTSRWHRCRELSETAVRVLSEECRGVAWELDASTLYGMRALYFLGELKELRRQLPLALREAQERGDVYMTANLRLALGSTHVWLAENEPETARKHATDAIRAWNYPGVNLQHLLEMWSLLALELYEDDVGAAEARVADSWPRIRKTMYMRMQVARMLCIEVRARVALAGATARRGSEREERLRHARRLAGQLRHEQLPWGDALAAMIEAAAARQHGDVESADHLLESAERNFERADMALHAAVARRQRGVLVGGDEGHALVANADSWMSEQLIQSPARFASLFAPGF
jgi:serine/threonine protein kinase/tetratricopeptide (TPR) repeat protein